MNPANSNPCHSVLRLSTALLLASALLAGAQSPQPKALAGHVPAAAAGLQPTGHLDPAKTLRLSINLQPRNQGDLTNLLAQIYDPASPQYRHYLAPEEFDARFGPTAEDYAAVAAFVTSNGLSITAQHPNHMLLEVSATVADIERAFQISLLTYAHPKEAREFYAPDRDPSVAAGVPILHIAGLENSARPHPRNLRHQPLKTADATARLIGSGPNGNLAGFDYRAAYAPGVSLTGTGQQVGLLEFDGYYASDITAYRTQTGVPNVPIQVLLLDGFNGVPTTGAQSGNSEVALDIEMAMSMAPGLARVVVYEADPTSGQPNDILYAMSTNTTVKQFSCSWGFGSVTGSQQSTMDFYFQKMAAQGQSFFDASGDSGAEQAPIEPPGDDPYIIQVGGTTLATAGPGGAWLSETVWNAGFGPSNAGSSGGISSTYGIPTWQQAVSMTANGGSTVYRNVPDVAMVADNIFIVADDGYQETTGGTSAAAPLWAAFTALANQQAAAAGQPSVGFMNPTLYSLGNSPALSACFDDVTVGNNTNFDNVSFFAVPGYDLCTGWGSPTGNSMLIALTQPDGFQITPGRGAVANGAVGGPFSVTNQTFTLTNTGTSAFNWALGAVPAWVSVSPTSGTLSPGGGTATVAVNLNPAAGKLAAGVYTAGIWFTNLGSGLAQLRQFTLQAGQELVQDGGFEAGDFCYWTLSGDSSVYNDNFADDGSTTGYTPEGGNYFAAMGQLTTLAYLSQPLATRPGQVYRLSFWLENPSGLTPNQFQVQWNTSTSANIITNRTSYPKSGWANLVFTVSATTNVTTLVFGFRNDQDYFGLDNVSVLPVPVPNLQTTLSATGGITLTWPSLARVPYQLQYKSSLTQATWTNLGGLITATGTSTSYTDTLVAGGARFYRVVAP